EARSARRVKEGAILGRRGPGQAAFTTVEVKELGGLPGADVVVRPEEAALDALSAAELETARAATKAKVEIVQEFSRRTPAGKPRRLNIRFLVSPHELLGDGGGRVAGLRLAKNRLVKGPTGAVVTEPTGETEELPAGLVFRSVGYRGVPLPDVPFDDRAGLIPNVKGRVLDPATGTPIAGHYATGWIKRGPTGVIGNNKADSVETVNALLADAAAGALPTPARPDPADLETLVRERQPSFVSFADWKRLDRLEVERGQAQGRPRAKFTSVEEMLAALAGN
ncbi:MAG: NADP oxidoreductase, partial [Candidatus Eisenbacteria bacterium]